MAKQMMPNTGRDLIVSFNYDPTGLEWVECFDNAPLGWAVDDVDTSHPEPVVVGSLPPASADTAPIMSPVWAQYTGGYIVVPDVIRLPAGEFFTWLATNNGAQRQVRSSMSSNDLNQAYHQWSGGAGSSLSAPAGQGTEGREGEGYRPPVEGAYVPGRGPAIGQGPAADRGPGHVNGDGDRARPGEHRQEHDQSDEQRRQEQERHLGEHASNELPGRSSTAVDPMRTSDLGPDHAQGEHHRGNDRSPAAKPSEPKSPPHPNRSGR